MSRAEHEYHYKRKTTAEPPHKRGRKPFAPTEEQRKAVTMMVAAGTQYRLIWEWLGIDRSTFKRHFQREISFASLEVNTQVVGRLYKATSNSVEAIKVWLFNRDSKNWKDRRMLDATITVNDERPDFSSLTRDQLALVREAAAVLRQAAQPKQIEGSARAIPIVADDDAGDDNDATDADQG